MSSATEISLAIFHRDTYKRQRFGEESMNVEPQIRLPTHFALAVTIFVIWTGVALADPRERTVSFEVSSSDLAQARLLANRIAALSPGVRPEEGRQLALCAYAAARQLRRAYRVVWPPLFNNFLINSGIRKRGLCFQWAEDLLVRLDALKLTSLELHWGEADAGTWQESNCVVVTAMGQPFDTGIILDCWRHSGHLYWTVAATEKVRWVENSAYARFVRAKSAPKAFGANHRVAFQTMIKANRESDD
jgi:hypothetical protein